VRAGARRSAQQENREARLGGIGAVVAAQIEKHTGKETRVVVLGHLQRGGSPTNMDRALCTMFGAKAVEMIAERKFGQMVTHTGTSVESVALSEAIGHLRTVPLDGAYMHAARALGNQGDPDYVPLLVQSLNGSPHEMVRGMCAWSLGRLGGARAKAALQARRSRENGLVREEIKRALTMNETTDTGTD